MHPAFSVLIFTVMSGAGYGLAIILMLGHLTGIGQLQASNVILTSGIAALVLITLGLVCSMGHLANPKNAWRAFNRFATSWLSREGVFAVLFYPFFITYLSIVWTQGADIDVLLSTVGVIAAVIAALTLFCTSMIYASLKTIRQWNSSLTPLNYMLLGLMSGSLMLIAIQSTLTGTTSTVLYQLASALLVLGAVAKIIYLFWIGKPAGSTINTATGFTQASVRLFDQGHTSNGFLNNEFGYTVAANKIVCLRGAMLVLAFLIPFLLLLSGSSNLFILATVLTVGGLLIERWLFFAEARHVVRLYHGDQRT